MKKKLDVMVTRLEMLAPPQRRLSIAAPEDAALLRADRPPIHFYRYLYHQVGMKHFWISRKHLSDRELAHIIHDDRVEIYVLYQHGAPAGFAEIDFRTSKLADLVFLGLMEEKIGHGLGVFLLNEMIRTAWDKDIRRLIIETCTLDHPRALPLYQRAGFSPFERKEYQIEVDAKTYAEAHRHAKR